MATPRADDSRQPLIDRRATVLQRHFESVARTRMAGLPVLHAGLRVEAVGFRSLPDEPGVSLGVLITPWFMNLVRLPFERAATQGMNLPGLSVVRRLADRDWTFIGAGEGEFGGETPGPMECSSLFSPMFEFVDQAAARATALGVLELVLATPALVDGEVSSASSPRSGDGDAPQAGLLPSDSGRRTNPAAEVSSASGTDAVAVADAARPPVPARRGFLFGRRAAGQER